MSELTHCTKVALRSGFYDGLLLVDERGRRLDVTGARKIRIVPPKPSLASLLDWIGNPRYEVELVFTSPIAISLEDVRTLIFESFTRATYLWEEMIDFDAFRDKIAAATSLEQVFSTFKDYHV